MAFRCKTSNYKATKLVKCVCFDVTTHLHSGRGIFSDSYDRYAHSFFNHLFLSSSFELEPLEFFLEDEFLSGVCINKINRAGGINL